MKLSNIRRVLAISIFTVGTLFILQLPFLKFDFFSIFPKVQIVPAVLAGSVTILIVLAVLSILFGRLYCSVICPLGIFQDVLINLNKRRINKNQALRKDRNKYQYEKPQHVLRYSILAIAIISAALGSTLILILFDPYSIYTRLSVHIFHPVGVAINNGLAKLFESLFNSYAFAIEHYLVITLSSFLVTVFIVGLIIFFALKKDRFWCNAICPVGTLLGLISKISVLRVAVNQHECVSCGKCSKECKSHAIDNTNGYKIDYTRCISCYNCIDSCDKKKAIKLTPISKL